MSGIKNAAARNSILIVDDEKSNLLALTLILNKDYTVYAAKNGQEAIDITREYLPDVILLDIIMPEMDGYEVISILKLSQETRSIPIIFISGLGSVEDEEKGLALGASDYITKPFQPAIVKLRVQNQILLSNQFNLVKTLSLTDQLTGLFNRRGYDSRLQLEWNRAKRDQTLLALFFVDIDNFKKYNDTYGHLQGDEALKMLASTIEHTLKRAIDFSARWGGEEFVVLLPHTESDGACSVAERILENIRAAEIPSSSKDASKITISIGVNIYMPKPDDISIQEFVNRADQALYKAKRNGKNQVCVYEEDIKLEKGDDE